MPIEAAADQADGTMLRRVRPGRCCARSDRSARQRPVAGQRPLRHGHRRGGDGGFAGAARLALALLAATLLACGSSSSGPTAPDASDAASTWAALYWVNSNSAPTFAWSLAGVAARSYVAVPLNGQPNGAGNALCAPFGGAVTPGVAAKSMHDALPAGASIELWMQPRDEEFAGVSVAGLKDAAERELAWFQSCVEQDWPQAPTVSGFLCVKEQRLGGAADCDTLQQAFEQGVRAPGAAGNARYGILGAPGNMSRTDIDAALGEMYEPIYFPPGQTCPDPGDGATYGGEIGDWITGAAVVPQSGSVAVPAFGGPSSTCSLDYGQLAPAAAALSEKVPAGLAGLGLWG